MSEPTARPWSASAWGPQWTVCAGTKPVCDIYRGADVALGEDAANAAHIVRCVNHFDQAIDILREVRHRLGRLCECETGSGCGDASMRERIDRLLAACARDGETA